MKLNFRFKSVENFEKLIFKETVIISLSCVAGDGTKIFVTFRIFLNLNADNRFRGLISDRVVVGVVLGLKRRILSSIFSEGGLISALCRE